jgi:hypothetical protein
MVIEGHPTVVSLPGFVLPPSTFSIAEKAMAHLAASD